MINILLGKLSCHLTLNNMHESFAYSNVCFTRGDVVEVDTWVSKSGKNGMRRDWLVRDCNTGEILTRASRLASFCFCLLLSYYLIIEL